MEVVAQQKMGCQEVVKSNGNCGTGTCGSGSEKLAVFDWLSNMTLPSGQEQFQIFEVRFKNGRKHFFNNVNNLSLRIGDVIAVESSPGHDVGNISLAGELVKVQMKKGMFRLILLISKKYIEKPVRRILISGKKPEIANWKPSELVGRLSRDLV